MAGSDHAYSGHSGLVLAVGIVVDDAIIVVEGIEKHIRDGLAPRDAAKQTMNEVSGALIATSLVLAAVFIPTAAVSGISGQFYRQFAVTITAATAISLLVSLTLAPSLAAMLLKPHSELVALVLQGVVLCRAGMVLGLELRDLLLECLLLFRQARDCRLVAIRRHLRGLIRWDLAAGSRGKPGLQGRHLAH